MCYKISHCKWSITDQGLPAPHCAVYALQLGLVGFLVVGLRVIGATVGFEDTGAEEGALVTGDSDIGASVTGAAITGAEVSAFEGAGVIGEYVGSADKVLPVVGADDAIGDLVG